MNKRLFYTITCLVVFHLQAAASRIFIPMDAETQTGHLKAYGVAYAALKEGMEVDWLLNYQGGSFALDQTDAIERMCKLRGVNYEVISDAQYTGIVTKPAKAIS